MSDSEDEIKKIVKTMRSEMNSSFGIVLSELSVIKNQLEVITDKIDKQTEYLFDFESRVLKEMEESKKLLKKGIRGIFRNSRKLDAIDGRIEEIQDSVEQVKDFLKQSNIEIKVTASDFEGALKSISVPKKESENGKSDFRQHSFDEMLRVDQFIASNIYRMSENGGEFLKEGPVKKMFRNLKPGHIVSEDKIAESVRQMSKKDIKGLEEARDLSLKQMTEQVAFRMRSEMYKKAEGSGEPLESKDIEKIYLEEVEKLRKDGWKNGPVKMGVIETPEMIAQNALVLINENREYFMNFNKGHFESEIDSIFRSLKNDERKVTKIPSKGRLSRFMNEARSGNEENLKYDPNSMNSLFTAKNMAYLLRASGSNLVHSRSKAIFGDDVASELKTMAKRMKTREGMMTAMKDYIVDNQGEPGAPPEWMIQDVDTYFSDLKSHFNSNSYEARFIVKRAFDIAIAKKDPNSYRHLGASETSMAEKEMADLVIAGACTFDCKEALDYAEGKLDPRRQNIRESYIRVMEENGSMNKLIKHISKDLPQNHRGQGHSFH